MEVRTGKTLTALGIAQERKARRVVFLTKKKAISSIESDYKLLSPGYDIIVINYESMHKHDLSCDVLIIDEAHGLGAFPKPSGRSKDVRYLFETSLPKVIWLSGTPTPESYSQMYHQTHFVPGSPFYEYKNFYRFADDYVNVRQKKIGTHMINDYSDGKEDIIKKMEPYTISYTQSEAGFESEIIEEFLFPPLPLTIKSMMDRLEKDLVIEGKNEVILADTPVKLMSKLHQMSSGTIKFESGESMVLSTFKSDFIRDHFKGKKIGIFYKFKAELDAIEESFGKDNVTSDLSEFDSGRCDVIALQIVSGREGISLRNADVLVFMAIDFSATSYWQARDRMTTKDRKSNTVYWVFSDGGIERDIYEAVSMKKTFTMKHFSEKHEIGYLSEVFCNECAQLIGKKRSKKNQVYEEPCNLTCLP